MKHMKGAQADVFRALSTDDSEMDVSRFIESALVEAVRRVKRARRWHLVDPLSKAFIRAYLIMKPTKVRSLQLIKTLVKTIKKLRDLISEARIPIKAGIRKAWRLSSLASSWGHPSAENWRNDKAFILYQAITLKWLSKLFGGVVFNEF